MNSKNAERNVCGTIAFSRATLITLVLLPDSDCFLYLLNTDLILPSTFCSGNLSYKFLYVSRTLS